MAVVAYSSLVSLTHVLDNLHYRAPFQLPHMETKHIEVLQENVQFLLEFVELHSERESPKLEALWRKMAEVAFETEDMIDFHVVNQLNLRSQGQSSDTEHSTFFEDMEKVITKTNYIKQGLPSIGEEGEDVHAGSKRSHNGTILRCNQPSPSVPDFGSSSTYTGGKNVVVGIDEHVVQIMDELIQDEPDLQILPIVGMGGIGKTTLARSVFDHPHIVSHFDIRVWFTISQEYNTNQTVRGVLYEGGNKGTSEHAVELGHSLYQTFLGRRCLVVMDDVWTTEAWDDLKMFFPNDGCRSRILLTTRLLDVATCLGTFDPYLLSFLDGDKSWELFCQTTFAQIGCPYVELEEIAKYIAQLCRGLPLEIVTIGGLLANADMTLEYWKSVAENINSFRNLGDHEHCLKVLHLSYKSLPIHLKPCFLYMRFCREDGSIPVVELTGFWIAEGFIKEVSNKTMEESATEYLKDLHARNLILVREMGVCGIHDLLLDLCWRESKNECLIRSPKVQCVVPYLKVESCFLGCDVATNLSELTVLVYPPTTQVTRFVCDACKVKYLRNTIPRVVRAMDGVSIFSEIEIEQPTEVRYASIFYFEELKFISLHLLWNLQILNLFCINSSPIVLPPEIWEMPQLRCFLSSFEVLLPDPVVTHHVGEDFIVLKNLEVLYGILNFKCTKEILDRVPNLKDIKIHYSEESEECYSHYNLDQLQKLEILHIHDAMQNVSFPNSLKELSLVNCQMSWEDMSIIGQLPRLETLKLDGGIQGSEWNPVEGEFLRLKRLVIGSVDLVSWIADETHFPILGYLVLKNLYSLEGIPLDIGGIPTLEYIGLSECNDSIINSGKQIWKEQQSMGNEGFKTIIDGIQYQDEDDDSDS